MKLKICGFTVPEHIADAAALGLDYAGLVLWPGSSRCILSRQRAMELAQVARGVGADPVGVFVNQDPDEVLAIADEVRLAVLQLHGDESPEQIARYVAEGRVVWKAFAVGEGFDVQRAREAWDAGAEAVLLDAVGETRGGTGRAAHWPTCAEVARAGRVVLAGGLGPTNVAEAIAAVKPWSVDASSKLETYPGFKDHVAMRAFLDAARG